MLLPLVSQLLGVLAPFGLAPQLGEHGLQPCECGQVPLGVGELLVPDASPPALLVSFAVLLVIECELFLCLFPVDDSVLVVECELFLCLFPIEDSVLVVFVQ